MLINLFDIQDKKVCPSQNCFHIPELKAVMDTFPDDYLNIFRYIAFMYCPDSSNPYVNQREDEKEDMILSDYKSNVSLEESLIVAAIEKCRKLWETSTYRLWLGQKKMVDKVGRYLDETEITEGKDSNAMAIDRFMKQGVDYAKILNEMENMLKEEQSKVRGNTHIPYHQRPGYTEKENALDQ